MNVNPRLLLDLAFLAGSVVGSLSISSISSITSIFRSLESRDLNRVLSFRLLLFDSLFDPVDDLEREVESTDVIDPRLNLLVDPNCFSFSCFCLNF